MTTWYAAYTQPHKEAQAALHLGNQGFAVYLPRYRKTRRHAGREEVVIAPLFPRYLFVSTASEQQGWRSVNGTIGVVHLVQAAERPIPVPERVIAAICAREDESGLVTLAPENLNPGQSVRIAHRPMAELEALFQQSIDYKRAHLLVSLLGQLVRVNVPLHMVQAA